MTKKWNMYNSKKLAFNAIDETLALADSVKNVYACYTHVKTDDVKYVIFKHSNKVYNANSTNKFGCSFVYNYSVMCITKTDYEIYKVANDINDIKVVKKAIETENFDELRGDFTNANIGNMHYTQNTTKRKANAKNETLKALRYELLSLSADTDYEYCLDDILDFTEENLRDEIDFIKSELGIMLS